MKIFDETGMCEFVSSVVYLFTHFFIYLSMILSIYLSIIIYLLYSIDTEQTQSQIKECDDLLRRLSSSKNNALSGFGRWMIDLVNTINKQQHQFRCLPKGPIGGCGLLIIYLSIICVSIYLRVFYQS